MIEVQQNIQNDLKRMQETMKQELKSGVFTLDTVISYLLRTQGKQIRPSLCYLTARMVADMPNKRTDVGASMIEMLHNATLIHDDVVDESDMRRGLWSIPAIWKNKISVLVGDYIMSKGLLIAMESQNYDLLHELSQAVALISEGELAQLEKAKRLNITEKDYYNIISKKTASLIQTSCKVGAMSVSQDSKLIQAASDMGLYMGMAFQIKDDLLDLDTSDTGKPKSIDIKDKKMTLPLIYTLQNVSPLERIQIKTKIRFKSKSEGTVKSILELIHQKGGITYAEKIMNDFIAKSHHALSLFPDSDYKIEMGKLIDKIGTRTR